MIEIKNDLASSFEGLDKLIEVYNELDSIISNFKNTLKIDCIKYCSKCCGTSAKNIEVSVFELIPLSIHLWQKGEADNLLEKLSQIDIEAPCALYNGEYSPQFGGGCSIYTWRPLLCRLFGFSAVLNKQGKPVVSLCKQMKVIDSTLENRVQKIVDQGLEVPINSYFAQKVALINPFLGQPRYSINEALKLALETVGYRLALIKGFGNDSTDDNPPKHPPFGKTA